MKLQRRSLFIISIVLLMCSPLVSQSQNEGTDEKASDTLVFKQKYGLRLGGDMGKIIRTAVDKDYTGFEILGDYRITKRLYLAGEIGTEERRIANDFLDVTATGSYFKAGIDYNSYTNWLDMQNMIFTGFRVGASTFSQTLNSYTVYNTDQYWGIQNAINPDEEIKGLTAIWAELILGIKAEVFSNLFVGLNIQIKAMVAEDEPDQLENLYVPGFNRTYDSGRFGIGFGYTMSYLIPIYKKDKKVVVESEEN